VEKTNDAPKSYRDLLKEQEAQYNATLNELAKVPALEKQKNVLEGSMAMLRYVISQEDLDAK